MRKLAVLGVALALSATPAAPVQAKAGDKARAQCVWEQAPQSAAEWLRLPVPTWQTWYEDVSVRLGHRIIALCDPAAANPLRPNRMPNWKILAAALRRAQPKQTAPARASSAVQVLLCVSTVEEKGKTERFLYEVVRRTGGQDTISFQQHYAHADGQALKLPQDLRVMPSDTSKVKRSCRTIAPNGELADV